MHSGSKSSSLFTKSSNGLDPGFKCSKASTSPWPNNSRQLTLKMTGTNWNSIMKNSPKSLRKCSRNWSQWQTKTNSWSIKDSRKMTGFGSEGITNCCQTLKPYKRNHQFWKRRIPIWRLILSNRNLWQNNRTTQSFCRTIETLRSSMKSSTTPITSYKKKMIC